MNDLDFKLWKENNLFPLVYENLDRIFPEMEFKKRGDKWESPYTFLGEKSSTGRSDKTVSIRKNLNFYQNGEEFKESYIDRVMRVNNISNAYQAGNFLADAVGIEHYSNNSFDKEAYVKAEEKNFILESINNYCIKILFSSSGGFALEYYQKRGLSIETIKKAKLGVLPRRTELSKYLFEISSNADLIKEILSNIYISSKVGEEINLSIPFLVGGKIKGFIFRNRSDDEKDKNNRFSNYRGNWRDYFFNIPTKGEKLLIVEGAFDALSSGQVIKDYDSVAIASLKAGEKQIKDAISRGYKEFTFVLDYDAKPFEEILKTVISVSNELIKLNVRNVYFSDIKDENNLFKKVDPNDFIRTKGAEAYQRIIDEALPYHKYIFELICNKYFIDKHVEGKEGLTDKEKSELLQELIQYSENIKNPFDRKEYSKLINDKRIQDSLGYDEEDFANAVESLAKTKLQEEQLKKVKDLTSKVSKLNKSDNLEEVIAEIETGISDIKHTQDSNDFASLLEPITEDKIKEEESNLPPGLNVDLWIDGQEYEIPSGAISVFAGPTNHGKTVALINSILNASKNNEKEKFVLFTYEERANVILSYLLSAYIGSNTKNESYLRIFSRSNVLKYFRTGKIEGKDIFEAKKQEFFNTYINTGRIIVKQVDFASEDLCNAINYLNNSANIGGIFIDYFQLINLKNKKGINARYEELKIICNQLNRTAIETGLPIVLAAQFNQTVKYIEDIHLTAIGEAGDISRIANLIIGIYQMAKLELKPIKSKNEDAEARFQPHPFPNKPFKGNGMFFKVLKSRSSQTGKFDILEFIGSAGYINFSSTKDLNESIKNTKKILIND